VFTNDLQNPQINLSIAGQVEDFAEISQKRIRLEGPTGKSLVERVLIIPKSNYPFKIVEAKAETGVYIHCTLDAYKDKGRAGYVLIVENRRQEAGRYYDAVHLKTDSKIKPEIVIGVYGFIRES